MFKGKHFVISKLFKEIKNILDKKSEKITFGDLSIIRDWGWAPSYVEAIYKMTTAKKADDYIIATGKSYSLRFLIDKSFELAGLGESEKFIEIKNEITRPNELKQSYLDPSKIESPLIGK